MIKLKLANMSSIVYIMNKTDESISVLMKGGTDTVKKLILIIIEKIIDTTHFTNLLKI